LRTSHRALSAAPYDTLSLPFHSFSEDALEPIPSEQPFELVIDLLPTSMAIELIGVLFYSGHLPKNAIFDLFGLLGYLLLFSFLSAWKLRWK